MKGQLVLEDGYNTDYIYSLILALFYLPSDGVNRIINEDMEDSNAYYLQEFIKMKLIYLVQRGSSIESKIVNRLRMYCYNSGWLSGNDQHILSKVRIDTFYNFLISDMMGHSLEFTRADPRGNQSNDLKFPLIHLNRQLIEQVAGQSVGLINLSDCVDRWIEQNVSESKYLYKFKTIPQLVSIYIDQQDSETNENARMLNIMEGFRFGSVDDKVQKLFIWEIHSLILMEEDGTYYTICITNLNKWTAFSDHRIPSNWDIDMTNIEQVRKIIRQVVFVFYKIA